MLYTRNDIRAIQGTLREEIQCTGHGLRSANEVSLKILPVPANSGISFLRRDVTPVPCSATIMASASAGSNGCWPHCAAAASITP
jgi:UDP-3-O-acyl-N-acetylglucosamine deacetylase